VISKSYEQAYFKTTFLKKAAASQNTDARPFVKRSSIRLSAFFTTSAVFEPHEKCSIGNKKTVFLLFEFHLFIWRINIYDSVFYIKNINTLLVCLVKAARNKNWRHIGYII